MATRFCSRSLIYSAKRGMNSLFARSFTSSSLAKPAQDLASAHTLSLLRLRPLAAVATKGLRNVSTPAASARGFSSRPATSSLNDSNPNWSNRPPKETILLDGCDFEHWLVVVEPPDEKMTRDEIIDSYIKTLAQIVGSEEEARMKIYSVSTRCYFAFGALVSEELSYKLKEIPHVRWVLPDSYLDVKNKDYGGEPFINGQAVPYDPKYHEEWIRNNARANERNKRNDRPRPRDRSRNFDRREMQQHPQQQFNPNAGRNVGQGVPQNMGPSNPVPGYTTTPNNMGSGGMQSNNMNSMPSNNYGGGQPHSNYMDGNGMQQNNRGGGPNQAGPVPNQSSFAPNMAGGNPYQNRSMPSAIPPNPQYRNAPNGGNPYQSGPGQFQNYAPGSNQNSYAPGSNQNSYAPPDHGPNQSNYAPSQNSYAANVPGGNPYQNQNMPGGEIPPPQKY